MSDALMQFISMAVQMLVDQIWAAIATLFDLLRHIGPLGAAMIVGAACVLAVGVAWAMQWRLNRRIEDNPRERVSLFRQEAMFSVLGFALFLIALPFLIVYWLFAALKGAFSAVFSTLFSKDDESEGGQSQDNQATDAEDAGQEDPPAPVVVATIGPSFLWAALIVAGLYVLGHGAEPLMRGQLGISDGQPAWQFLLLGGRPELEWYLPLERFPYLGAVVATGFWMVIWWWMGRFVRIIRGSELGANLAERVDDTSVLASWRDWFGARDLHRKDASYTAWAMWLPVAAIPLLGWSWGTISAEPYRMGSSMFAVTLIVWLSWTIHLVLSGKRIGAEEEAEEEPERQSPPPRGWPQVLEDLETRLQVAEPYTFDAPRRVEPLSSAAKRSRGGVISPLLDEILDDGGKLTHMQHEILETLSYQAYVHVEPPADAGELELKEVGAAAMRDQTGQRHANQIVLAPDASGKTTLAMLAACNHALIHTRSTLVVTRDEPSARRFSERMRKALEPSTLRWTVRVKRAGSTLVDDLSQGIIPDVIVTSLHQLVTGILDEPRTYAPFLKNLGLIVVDDAERFCGPVEIHAQLAFRRLTLRVRDLLGGRQLGEESAPVMLVLSTDSMHKAGTWAKTLCSIDGVVRTFDYADSRRRVDLDAGGESSASNSASDDAFGGMASIAGTDPARHHLFYHLDDFETESGERIKLHELIASCERMGVPWHYRKCGDQQRHLGRQHLDLEQEPEHYVSRPLDACVVFLDGQVSTVRREIDHLPRAGLHYHPVTSFDPNADEVSAYTEVSRPTPIAFVSVVDSDERMALTEFDPHSSLTEVVRSLPRPVVRAPSGRAVESHLAADMVDTWTEVRDVLEVFGNTTARTLTRLADQGLLIEESRTDLSENENDYENLLYVRVPSQAVAQDEEEYQRNDTRALLPPKLGQVEQPPGPSVSIRDRTNLTVIDITDPESARHLYYPGRIFETAQGRFTVVGTAAEEGSSSSDGPVAASDIMVEPFLNDDVSSPRRRTHIRPVDEASARGREAEAFDRAEPVFIGDYPLAVFVGEVECRTRHLATVRLDPHDYGVRQRKVYADEASAPPDILHTVALGIIANPDNELVRQDPDCPKLQLRDARLIAAAMRAVLPSMYRGSAVDIQVGVHLDADDPAADHELSAGEGFFLYDPHAGGNGAARAIQRDGVELLLRLCRVYLERVLYHDRLRARYDYWGDDELFGPRGSERTDGEDQSVEARDRAARKRVLKWLDSRLRPEGSTSTSRRRGSLSTSHEEGEGDVIDLGRCWYGEGDRAANLVWTKHRWRLTDDDGEAMLDVGIDRKTAAKRRFYGADDPRMHAHMTKIARLQQSDALMRPDQTVWGGPDTVFSMQPDHEAAVGSDGNLLKEDDVKGMQAIFCAVAADALPILEPLAQRLVHATRQKEDVEHDDDWSPQTEQERRQISRALADFVQSIPFASNRDPGRRIRGPVHTLLYRVGDGHSQAILLASLLKHAGVESGLFYEPSSGRVMAAAELPDPAETTASDAGDVEAEAVSEQMGLWAKDNEHDGLLMWAEHPPHPAREHEPTRLLVPIDVARNGELAVCETEQPEQWVFLPLNFAWHCAGAEKFPYEGEGGS